MPDWSSYSPSDFVMFSARAYYGLFAIHNRRVWPAQLLAIVIGIAIGVLVARGSGSRPRVGAVLLSAVWGVVAASYFLVEYATIHTFARWFAALFAVEAVLLLITAAIAPPAATLAAPRVWAGICLIAVALLVQPLIAPLSGRPWAQVELFALAPDPTVVLTLGALLLLSAGWSAWVIPLLWIGYDALTLRVLHAPEWALLPLAGTASIVVALVWRARPG